MVQYLDDGRTDGSTFGNTQGTTTQGAPKISFYSGTPVVQPTGNALAAASRTLGGGMVVTFSVTNSPTSVTTVTTNEKSITVIGGTGATVSIATTDMVYITKPTSQAGLFVGNVRASAAFRSATSPRPRAS